MKSFFVMLPLFLSLAAMMSGLVLAIVFTFTGLTEVQARNFMVSLGIAWMPSLVAISAAGPWVIYNWFMLLRETGAA